MILLKGHNTARQSSVTRCRVTDVATLVLEQWKRLCSWDQPFVAAVARSVCALLYIRVAYVIKAQAGKAGDSARSGRRLSDVILPKKHSVALHYHFARSDRVVK
jgi:hypothetical protein